MNEAKGMDINMNLYKKLLLEIVINNKKLCITGFIILEFPQNVISKRIYCSEVPICRFFESLRMAVLKIEALE